MSVYKPKNSKYFLFDFKRGGRRFHGSTGQTEEREAKRIERAEIKKAEGAVIPIAPELRALLCPLRGQHEVFVFTYVAARSRVCARSGRRFEKGERYPITYEGLATHIGRAIRKAGLKDFRLHDLRHTAASRFQRANKNLRLTQALLNHSSPKMTVRYAHVDGDDLREGMAQATSDNWSRRTKSRKKLQNQPAEQGTGEISNIREALTK